MEKYIRQDGKVAAIISPSFGAGWSTWAEEKHREAMVFDKDLVRAILKYPTDPHGSKADQAKIAKEKWPKEYMGGLDDGLKVEWLDPGADFMIHEYDGSESVWTKDDIAMYRA